jgi:hypothetical protein
MPAWLLHPLPLAAILVTAANDQLLKGSGLLPAWLTGKLSDFAGLFFFPLVVAAVLRAKTAAARTIVVVATGALFAAFKLSPRACAWIAPIAGVTPDATDLIALPMLAVAWWWMARLRPSPRWNGPAWTRTVVLGGAALTSAATSPVRGPYTYRPLPMWSAVGVTRQAVACANVDLWVSKSGREGVGLTIAFDPRGAPCELRLDRVALVIPGEGDQVVTLPPERVDLAPEQRVHRYVALPFDNTAAWRHDHHAGFIRLDVTASDGAHALRFDVVYAQAPRPHWGTNWPISIVVAGESTAGLQLVVRLYPVMTGARIESIELVARGVPPAFGAPAGEDDRIVVQPLSLAVESVADEPAEVPIFLPFDAARRGTVGTKDLRVRVLIAGDGHEPEWLETHLYPPPDGDAP